MSDPAIDRLAGQCGNAEQAAQQALAWLRDYPERVAAQRPVLEKDFRLQAVTARKLRAAAARPVAVGVYGLSQAGKSYLISTLARPPGQELKALLDQPRGFLADINPESEKEATGLVTRFTMRREAAPAGFPARLRLLSETDLVKILANSWYCDALDATKTELPAAEIEKLLTACEAEARGARAHGELAQEDIWDLQSYVELEFRRFPTAAAFAGPFWDRMAAMLPVLPLARRVELYELLWHRFAPFTGVLRRLGGRLQDLRFDREVWAPIKALVPKTDSVLRVDTLDHLADADGPRLDIQAQNGARCTLTRAELTALVAELQISMAELPWPIFESTDLLDFPGARERTGKDHAAEINARSTMLGEFFLRGKVAYLFERYAAERELNALLLCIKESNNPYDATIRQSIRQWIHRTHGERPEDRARVETALFVVLTRVDMHFNRTPGRADDAPSGDLWEARIKASMLQPLQEAKGWLDEWHPGTPFRNTLLARNPGKSQSLSVLEDGKEVGFQSGIPEKIERWGREFAAHADVRRYMDNPERAWAEVFRPNDAGMSYLVERLTPVCRPELKLRQVSNQLAMLREGMRRRLAEWHVSDDLDAEVAKRRAALRPALEVVEANGANGRFGLLLTMFHLEAAEALQILLGSEDEAERTGVTAEERPKPISLRGRLPGGAAAQAPDTPSPRMQALARVLAAGWIGKLRRFAAEAELRGHFGFEAAQADALVAEIIATAVRCRLPERLAQMLQRTSGGQHFVQSAERRAVRACQIVNEQLNFVGLRIEGMLAAERPVIGEDPAHPGARLLAFTPPAPPGPGFEIGPQPVPFGPMFCLGWVDSLADAVERNVRDREGGGMVDRAENDALGAVLALLQESA
ncbi:conserved protein of unknown function [Rhodovastum atsumiense]|uniref:Virulence factor n=1 Tax=Rhodovastum atsumiense TaxID=504468 RepID=A0A5M6IV78_9PROT|nr:virulence factor SrfC family protein [Rhodovastum atsumiense]KAA5612182.1 hypothetical protein F1189_10995 [Rhodovastum atsumiense]CAH2603864.1 conserved protein of unknown function [Rhodovastum atsumiense]